MYYFSTVIHINNVCVCVCFARFFELIQYIRILNGFIVCRFDFSLVSSLSTRMWPVHANSVENACSLHLHNHPCCTPLWITNGPFLWELRLNDGFT